MKIIALILGALLGVLGIFWMYQRQVVQDVADPIERSFVEMQPEIQGVEYVGPPIRRTLMDTIQSRTVVDPHLDLGLHATLAEDSNKIPYRRGVIPINIETRGGIPNYDQVGYIFNEVSNERFPLFGRPKYIGSTQWEYYAQDDSRNRIPLPIENKNKELYDEDIVQIQGVEGQFTVNLYEQEKLRYIPF